MQDREQLQTRLESMDMAWVLVFDADTEEEAVYSMEVDEEEGSHVVLAFEDKLEAERYAVSLREEAYSSDASVQALDVEALVVTSRDADFRVGIVFKGCARSPALLGRLLLLPRSPLECAPRREGTDTFCAASRSEPTENAASRVMCRRKMPLRISPCPRSDLTSYSGEEAKEESASMGLPDDWSSTMDISSFITTGLDEEEERRKVQRKKERVSVSITMVPETCFEGKTASDFLDPTEDPVWVLVHDEGTGDAQVGTPHTAPHTTRTDEARARALAHFPPQRLAPKSEEEPARNAPLSHLPCHPPMPPLARAVSSSP